jgi:hypothetical protein
MDKLGHIMVMEFKILQGKKMLDIIQISRNQVIHANDMKTFFNKSIT